MLTSIIEGPHAGKNRAQSFLPRQTGFGSRHGTRSSAKKMNPAVFTSGTRWIWKRNCVLNLEDAGKTQQRYFRQKRHRENIPDQAYC
jgi:hypothetical protein